MVTKKYCKKLLEYLQLIKEDLLPVEVQKGMQDALRLRINSANKTEYLKTLMNKLASFEFIDDKAVYIEFIWFTKISSMLYSFTDKEFELRRK